MYNNVFKVKARSNTDQNEISRRSAVRRMKL